MTPNDIYAMPHEKSAQDPWGLYGCYFNHMDGEVEEHDMSQLPHELPRVEVREIKYFDFDGRRFWRLATVWFDGSPVMITQNAGREGDDWRKRFITDPEAFSAMGAYLRSLVKKQPPKDVVSPDQELGNALTEFYGNSLGGYFERY